MKMLKLFVSFLLLITFYVRANSDSDHYLFDQYAQFYQKTIIEISDDSPLDTISILLSDGTLWQCKYQNSLEKNSVLQQWENGQRAFISTKYHNSSELSGMYVEGTKTHLELLAELNTASADALPCITEISKGKIVLSDGSEWKENSLVYYSSKYWNLGDRIIVTCQPNHRAVLINIEIPRALILDAYYMDAILIKWN